MRRLKNIAFETISSLTALLALIILPLFILFYRLFSRRREQPRLVWGAIPIINNKYWSNALRNAGFFSKTMMFSYQSSINKEDDFDIDIYKLVDLRLGLIQKVYTYWLAPYVGFLYAVCKFDIFHHSFVGGFLGRTLLWRLEAPLLKFAKKRIVIIPIGFDAYLYSQIIDPSLRHVLLMYSTESAKKEGGIKKRINYWTKWGDILIIGTMIDGMGRWDIPAFNMVTLDISLWRQKERYSRSDGMNGVVKIIHTPNHRGYKGTEFVVQAVEELKAEGLKVELILVEGRQNDEVRRLMVEDADILAEQFIATAYAMTGIEGMASGLPVLANLEHEAYTRLFRRYAYLNECPVLSTTPETLRQNLRLLVTNPGLREELGRAGRRYVEKYHSEATAQYMFGAMYDKIWFGKEVDLLNLFHPLKSEYNRRTPRVEHPLIENRLPANCFTDVETFVS